MRAWRWPRVGREESIRQLRVLNAATAGVQKRRHLHDVHRLADFSPMPNPVQRLLILLAQATDRELARQVQYLKNENRVLRARLPEHIMTTPAERARLLKYGRPVGPAINQLITIVVPGTFHRWVREAKGQKRKKADKIGRPKKPMDLKKLILKNRPRTGWGYTRVLGEIRKLTRHKISRQTVANIMRRSRPRAWSQAGRKDLGRVRQNPAPILWQCRLLYQAGSDAQGAAVPVRAGVPERGDA